MKGRKYPRGSITVFLCLILTVLVSVILVCLESAHQAAGKAEVAVAADGAAEDVLSHYEKDLYEKYGILALNDRFDLKSFWDESLKAYGNEDMNGCHLQFQVVSSDQSGTVYLCDQNGKAFQTEVKEIVASDLAGTGVSLLKSQLEKLTESLTISETLSAVTEKGDAILILEEQYEEISKLLKKLRNNSKSLSENLDHYRSYLLSVEETDDTAVASYIEAIEKEDEKVITELQDTIQACKKYKTKAKSLSKYLAELEEDTKDETLSEEGKELLEQQYEAIETLTEGTCYQAVENIRKKAKAALNVLEKDYYPDSKEAAVLVESDEKIKAFFKKPLAVLESLESLKLEEASQSEKSNDDHEADSLIKTVTSIMKDGPWGYIKGDTSDLSDRKIAMDAMPSAASKATSEKNSESILKQAVTITENCCSMNYYIREYMDCYTDGGTCDLEYILGNKTTDLENMKSAVSQLVLARSALNAVYLLKDRSKYTVAEEAAAAITAATGTPEFIKVVTYIIIGAWAYAEAVCDVRTLVNGGKVPLMKSAKTWKLSLDNAGDALEDNKSTKSIKSGLSYKDYLTLLLFFHKRTRNMYRTLDMIQWNERLRDDGFRISQCIYQTTFNTNVRIDPVFYSGLSGILGKKAIFRYSHEEVLCYKALS